MNGGQPICIVSGAGGYLGSRVATALEQRGWQVLELTRKPGTTRRAIPFELGAEISPSALAGAESLVHCAYDFTALTWAEIHRKNVAGTEKLLRAARDAGIKNLVYLSSMSAFEGCRSLYGKAKLEAETVARSFGAIIIRPGLIWSESPGAIFGKLVKQVESLRVQPLFGGGRQIQYLVHEEDLSGFIFDCVRGKISRQTDPITIAHESPWRFRQVLEEIAGAKGKRLSFVSVPWRAVWLLLKSAEALGLRLDFRSDSLVSLMNQNPRPSFEIQRQLQIQCRPFAFAPENKKARM